MARKEKNWIAHLPRAVGFKYLRVSGTGQCQKAEQVDGDERGGELGRQSEGGEPVSNYHFGAREELLKLLRDSDAESEKNRNQSKTTGARAG